MLSKAGHLVFRSVAIFIAVIFSSVSPAFAQMPSSRPSAPSAPPLSVPSSPPAPIQASPLPNPSAPQTSPEVPSAVPSNEPPGPSIPGVTRLKPVTTHANGYTLWVAGRQIAVDASLIKEVNGILLLPIRPIAEAMFSGLEIDSGAKTIRITRAEDRQEVVFDARTGELKISNFSNGTRPNGEMVEWEPGKELVPANIVEAMLNVFVVIDPDKHQIQINTNNAAFADALQQFTKEETAVGRSRFHFPVYRLNAAEYNTAMNDNTQSRQAQTSVFRTTSQIGRNVINTYGTWLGSSKGPAWKYSIGGIDFINPHGYQLLMGDYVIKSGSLLINGFNHGFVAEKYWGKSTKVTAMIGKVQTSLTRIGLQTQRPLFNRDQAGVLATFDSADFQRDRRFQSHFWKTHNVLLGAGAGRWGDTRAGLLHGDAVYSYTYLHDAFSYFGGRFLGNTQLDLGGSFAKRELITGTKRYRPGGVINFRNTSTAFNHFTLTTYYARGSEHWNTLDTSNIFRNQQTLSQQLSVIVLPGVTVFGTYARNQPTNKSSPLVRTWAGGGALQPLPGVLPELSWTSNVSATRHRTAQYFNTMFFNQPLNYFHTKNSINGIWLFSNNGNHNKMESTFSLYEKTTVWKNITSIWSKQWLSPNVVNKQYQVDSGQLLGNFLSLNFGLGQAGSPGAMQSNWNIGGSIYLPWIGHRVGFAYNQVSKSFQFRINLSGYWGRPGVSLGQNNTPVRAIPPAGRISGRFYVDNDLSGTYDPSVDVPIANVRIICNNSVEGYTDKEGRYIASGLVPGFVSVTTDPTSIPARLAFMTPLRQDVFVFPNKTRTIDFRFARLSRIEGYVRPVPPTSDTPVRDVRVYIDKTERDTLTDEKGHFTITDVAPGRMILKVDPEYLQPNQEVVDGGATEIELKPGEKLQNVILQIKQQEVQEKHFK